MAGAAPPSMKEEDKAAGEGAGAKPPSAQRKSHFQVYLHQEFGGHDWVHLLWAFGKVDEDMIRFVNSQHVSEMWRKSQFTPRLAGSSLCLSSSCRQ